MHLFTSPINEMLGIREQKIDLDKNILIHINRLLSHKKRVEAVDLGGDLGCKGIMMAGAGAFVSVIDHHDYRDEFNNLVKISQVKHLPHFYQMDVNEIHSLGTKFNVINMQHIIEYLRYREAKQLLMKLSTFMSTGDTLLFLSTLGIDSAIGNGYLHRGLPVMDRFAYLLDEVALSHSIGDPVCLFHLDEIVNLLNETGWTITRKALCPTGEIKIIAKISQT